MNPMKQVLSTATRSVLAQAVALSLALAAAPAAWSQAGSAPAVRAGEPITLNFVNAEIEAVARTMATLTGRNLVVDPRVKGNLNLSTDKPVSPAAAFEQFTAALRLQGFALVESQGLYKIMPEAEAKLQAPTVLATDRAPAGGQIATQIFRLNHENANNLVAVLRPLISPNNTINVNPGTNSLVITDYADNLRRLGRIISALDVSNASDIEVIPLKHALANDLAPLVGKLLEGGSAAPGAAGTPTQGADSGFKPVLLPEPRSNALVLRAANPARLALVRALVEKLDRPNAAGTQGNIHVVYLKNADATQLAITLRAALAAENAAISSQGATGTPAGAATTALTSTAAATSAPRPATAAAGANAPVSGPAAPSVGGQIQADPATNALIITAPEPQFRQLRAVIDQLDVRRAQVYVESLIAEVNANKAAQFGIQWQGALGQSGHGALGLIGTNSGVAGANILDVTAKLASGQAPTLGGGLNVGVAPSFNGRHYLGALANFLQSTGDGNVLSTPNLLTLDNEEAKIVIGQNVPFLTGQYTNANTATGAVNPFQTIERKDVGITLRVRPQISESGTIKMVVFQEVSSIDLATKKDANGPTTNKRSIESSVLVEDGNIVVLGGLLSDEYGGSKDEVPGLASIPVLGHLFKNEARTRTKKNLMVFLRPVVVRDARQSENLALDRYELMRATQNQNQPEPNAMLGINGAPALPQLDLSQPARPLGSTGMGQP
ncbi:MAG: hypothetical protein RJA36_2753 [Pseudomonadota bacterium]|jgi:general secretion pathway protein D